MATRAKTLILVLSILLLSTTFSFSSSSNPRREEEQRRELERCKQECREREQGQQQRRQCEQWCQQQYEQQRHGSHKEQNYERRRTEERGENPYVFEHESFKQHYRSEHGSIRVLENFLERSKLHLGIANYRLAFCEANPHTFVVPSHYDADEVLFVLRGEGTITLLKQNKDRESHNIREGDILKVSAGTIMYLINRSNNQKLQIVTLLNPISTPGQFEGFYTVGGDQPESYYRIFSNEILEASLNTNRDELEKVFGQQRQGIIVRASQDQIRALSRSSSSSEHTRWPFGGESKSHINIFDRRPTFSNNHGKLYEVEPEDYEKLKDLDIRVAFVNITRGSMAAPYFNSRSTKIAIVKDGRGRLEIVCPHLSKQQEERWGGRQNPREEEEEPWQGSGSRYQLVRSDVSKNTVYIIPPGHPTALVATGNENLKAVCFEVNARNNRQTLLAGRNNIVSKMEREAQELAFGVPSELVESVFGRDRQRDEVFVQGPRQQWKEGGSRHPLESVLDFAGF